MLFKGDVTSAEKMVEMPKTKIFSSVIKSFTVQTVLAPHLAKYKIYTVMGVHSCPLQTHILSPLLRSQGDASSVGDLAFLQVLDQLCQPALGGGVVLQHLSKGAVLQLVWQTLTQGLSGSEII